MTTPAVAALPPSGAGAGAPAFSFRQKLERISWRSVLDFNVEKYERNDGITERDLDDLEGLQQELERIEIATDPTLGDKENAENLARCVRQQCPAKAPSKTRPSVSRV